MAKYVAVGVLAVIVLAALTYESPEQGKTAQVAVEENLEGAYGGEAPVTEEPQPLAERVAEVQQPEPAPSEEPAAEETPSEPTPVASPSSSAGEFVKHTVQKGETLSDVAQAMLGVRGRWREVYAYNRERIGESPNHVRVGLTLVFPKERLTVPASTSSSAQTVVPASSPKTGGRSYTVQKGDTLYGIARAQLGSGPRWKEIASLNGLTGAELEVGKQLQLPSR